MGPVSGDSIVADLDYEDGFVLRGNASIGSVAPVSCAVASESLRESSRRY
jgi:hypothetical protein